MVQNQGDILWPNAFKNTPVDINICWVIIINVINGNSLSFKIADCTWKLNAAQDTNSRCFIWNRICLTVKKTFSLIFLPRCPHRHETGVEVRSEGPPDNCCLPPLPPELVTHTPILLSRWSDQGHWVVIIVGQPNLQFETWKFTFFLLIIHIQHIIVGPWG